MLNLLPKEEKEQLRKDYKSRVWVVTLVLLVVMEIIAIILLLPTYISIKQRQSSLQEKFDNLTAIGGLQIKDNASGAIKQAQEKIDMLSGKTIIRAIEIKKKGSGEVAIAPEKTNSPVASSTLSLSDVIDRITNTREKGIVYSSIATSMDSAGKIKVSLEGIALRRPNLLAQVRSLESSGGFEKVSVPVSSFTEEKDIMFTLELFVK
jgi:hypothetical protein